MTIEQVLSMAIRYKIGREKLGEEWTIEKARKYEESLPRKLSIKDLSRLTSLIKEREYTKPLG